jgi:hypothetical protein
MLIREKKHFIWGTLLAVSFAGVFAGIFSPVFGGQNALQAADRLFNSIAKGSTYYIPGLLEQNERYLDTSFEADITLQEPEIAATAKVLLTRAGVGVTVTDGNLRLIGYLGQLLHAALQDADAMFNNQERLLAEKYRSGGREVLFVWWKVLTNLEKSLKRQKQFPEAAFVSDVIKRAVEVGYNFSAIEPEKASTKGAILSFSLVFYVVYTLWWGLAIFFLFEGIGLRMEAGTKKEV